LTTIAIATTFNPGGDKMNISLTPEMGKWVAEQVESGLSKATSEVIRDGLRCFSGG